MYCFALFVCLTLLASFFLPSHLSFKNMYMYIHVYKLHVLPHTTHTVGHSQISRGLHHKVVRSAPWLEPLEQLLQHSRSMADAQRGEQAGRCSLPLWHHLLHTHTHTPHRERHCYTTYMYICTLHYICNIILRETLLHYVHMYTTLYM